MTKYKNKELKNILNKLGDILGELFRKKYIKSNKIVAELGEHFSSKILNLNLNKKPNEKGYDAVDKNNKKVEIKTRQAHPRNQTPYIYSGLSGKIDYEYALLVLIDKNYWIKEIWKITKKNIQKYRTERGSINLTNNRKKIATRIYP